MFSLDGLSTLDYARSAALVIAFLAVFIGERTSKQGGALLMRADAIMCGITGATMLLAPQLILNHVSNVKPDLMATFNARSIGFMLLGYPVYYTMTKNKKAFYPTQVVLRTMAELAQLVVMVHTYMAYPKDFKPQMVSFMMLGTVLKLASFLVHLFTDVDFSAYKTSRPGNPLSIHLLIDSLVIFTFSTGYLLFPDVLQANAGYAGFKANSLQLFVFRMFGAYGITGTFIDMIATRFPEDQMKLNMFKARFAFMFAIVPYNLYYQFTSPVYSSTLYMFFASALITFFNNLTCILYTCKEKTS